MPWLKKSAPSVAAFLVLTGCFSGDVSRDEVARSKSPDGRTLAILLETNGGATTSYGYEVELRSASDEAENAVVAARLYGAARSVCAYGVNLRWLTPTELSLEFKETDQLKITPEVEVGAKTINVTASPGVTDETAPCGGMLASQG